MKASNVTDAYNSLNYASVNNGQSEKQGLSGNVNTNTGYLEAAAAIYEKSGQTDFSIYSVNSIQGTSDYAAIAKAKAYLGDMGFYDSKLDGYNDELKKALKCFQNAYLGGQTYNVENGIPSGLQNKIQDIGAAYYTNLTNSKLKDGLKKLGFGSNPPTEVIKNFVRIQTFLEKAMGCNKYQTAGIMGNIMQESRFSPTSTNGATRGILQWRDVRRGYLESYASKNGYSADNMGTQLAFFRYEMTRTWGKGDIDENAPNSELVKSWNTLKSEYKYSFGAVSDFFQDHIECYSYEREERRNYSSIIYQAIS